MIPIQTYHIDRKLRVEYLVEADALAQYDFHARDYLPAIPRFDRMDPLCERHHGHSPYLPFAANPVMYTDPTGEDALSILVGHTIHVYANVIFDDTIDDELIPIYKRGIDESWGRIDKYERWGEKYDVKWHINVRKQREGEEKVRNGVNNYFSKASPRNDNEIRASVEDGWSGELRTEGRNNLDLADDNPMGLEFGHILGLDDKYKDKGNVSIPDPGWEGDIMATPSNLKSEISERHLRTLFSDPIDIRDRRLERVRNPYIYNLLLLHPYLHKLKR